MKKRFLQAGKAICYLFLFLGAQMAASICCSQFFSYVVRTFGAMENKAAAFLLSGYSFYVSACSAILALGLLWLVFHLQNKTMRKVLPLNKIPRRLIPPLLLLAAGMVLVTNGVLQLLPDGILNAYNQASAVWSSMPLMYTLLATGLCAPVLEEIIFRGLILTSLERGMPSWAALLLSAFLFGICHGHPVWAIYAAVFGCVLGILTLVYGSLLPALLVHMIYNILGSLLPYLDGSIFSRVSLPIGLLLMGAGAAILAKDWQAHLTEKKSIVI